MPKESRPRRGSLQFYPRKRAAKFLPRINFQPIFHNHEHEGLLGFVAYKVGMASAIVKDDAPKIATSGKQITVPATILEVPNMKIFSVRFYKDGRLIKDILVSNDEELKKVVKVPKNLKNFYENVPKEYDDIKLIIFSISKQTSIKKTPDLFEMAISSKDKMSYVKSLIGREISLSEIKLPLLVDVHGLTKGHGTSGPVKRFGIKLKFHKTEKGVRRPGSLGPWHPAHVTFRTPMAGQLGLFSRVIYNLHVLSYGKISENNINPDSGFKNYGKINSSYIIIKGSVQGPPKRQLIITPASRPSSLQLKKKYEFVKLLK